jgi:hypothetical protein
LTLFRVTFNESYASLLSKRDNFNMLHSTSYTYKLDCNVKPKTWASRVALLLRNVADLIDGRHTLAIEMDSTPQISISVQIECMSIGLDHMTRTFKEAVRNEASEALMRDAYPNVFNA